MENENFINKIILVLLAALIFIIPVYFTTITQNIVLNKPLTTQILVLAMFCLWLINSFNEKNFELPKTPLLLPMTIFLVICCLISTFLSPFKYYSLEEATRFLSYFLLVLILIKFIKKIKYANFFIFLLLFITLITSIYGIMQIYNDDFINWGISPIPYVSTFGNKNFFAGFLVIIIPVALGVMLGHKNIAYKIFAFTVYLFASFNLIYSATRGAILGWFGQHILFTIFSIRYGILNFCLKKKRLFLTTLISISLFFIIVITITVKTSPYLKIQLQTIFQTEFSTNRVRMVMWKGALGMLRNKPLMGQGMGNFQLIFGKYRPRDYHRSGVSHNTRHAHNENLELASENGLLGITIFWWIIISYYLFILHQMEKIKNKYIRNIQIGFLSGIAGCLIHNLVSVNLRWTSTAVTFWFAIGLSTALCFSVKNRGKYINLKLNQTKKYLSVNPMKYILGTFLLIVFISYFIFCLELSKSDSYLKMGMVRVDNSPDPSYQLLNESEYYLTRSIKLYPFDLSSYYKLGYVNLQKGKKRYEEYIKTKNRNTYNDAIRLFKKASDMYDEIIKLAPNYAQIHNNIGMLKRQLGDKFESVRQFEWATTLENNERNRKNLISVYNSLSEYGKDRFGKMFFHIFKLKEINKEERQKVLNNFVYFCYKNGADKMKKELFENKFQNYTNLFKRGYRELGASAATAGRKKDSMNFIDLSLDLNWQNSISKKAVRFDYLAQLDNMDYLKKYFDKEYENNYDTEMQKIIFSQYLNVLGRYANKTKSNNARAEFSLFIAKSYKKIGDNNNAKKYAEQSLKFDTSLKNKVDLFIKKNNL